MRSAAVVVVTAAAADDVVWLVVVSSYAIPAAVPRAAVPSTAEQHVITRGRRGLSGPKRFARAAADAASCAEHKKKVRPAGRRVSHRFSSRAAVSVVVRARACVPSRQCVRRRRAAVCVCVCGKRNRYGINFRAYLRRCCLLHTTR